MEKDTALDFETQNIVSSVEDDNEPMVFPNAPIEIVDAPITTAGNVPNPEDENVGWREVSSCINFLLFALLSRHSETLFDASLVRVVVSEASNHKPISFGIDVALILYVHD